MNIEDRSAADWIISIKKLGFNPRLTALANGGWIAHSRNCVSTPCYSITQALKELAYGVQGGGTA
jgi:hypothetical protein